MKTLLRTIASLSVVATIGWVMSHEAQAAALDCLVLTKPIRFGTYSSYGGYGPYDASCTQYPDAFLTGRFSVGTSCENRGFLIMDVPLAPTSFASGELRISIASAWSPGAGEVFQLHQVTTFLGFVTNYTSSAVGTFHDLGDGVLMGSAFIEPQQAEVNGLPAETPLSIRLTSEAIQILNTAQGKRIAIGASLVNPPGETRALGEVLVAQSLESFTLAMKLTSGRAPEIKMLSTNSQILAGGTLLSLGALTCGQEPMTRQWYRDGQAIAGATQEIFLARPALPAQSGFYDFRVSNALGSATSAPVRVTVSPSLIYSPLTDLTDFDGTDSRCLSIGASSTLPLTFRWRHNGITLQATPRASFCFDPLTLTDSGQYDVVVSNAYGSVTSALATVTVKPLPPGITVFPGPTLWASAGRNFEIFSLASGSQPLAYQWLKNQAPLLGHSDNRLTFTSARPEDAGDFQIVAMSPYGAVTSSVTRLEVLPALLSGPGDADLLLGSRGVLWAQAIAVPQTSFQWYRESEPVFGATNTLLIWPTTTDADNGNYFLVASNEFGTVTSTTARVTIRLSAPTIVIYSSQPSPAVEGDSFLLGVNVIAAPPATFQWRKNNLEIPGETNLTLLINHAQLEDSADYTVTAVNSLGTVTALPIRMDVVRSAPQFIEEPMAHVESAGSLVILQSRATAGPPPQYEWRHHGMAIAGETHSVLILPHVSSADAGSYEVVARNPLGEARQSRELKVRPDTSLDHWDWSLPKPQGSRLRDIAWGNGRFVAVGKSGNIITSEGGTRWSHTIINADCDLSSVAFGDGRFVAVGTISSTTTLVGLVLISTDGMHWTQTPSPIWWPMDIAFGAGRFLLTGSGGTSLGAIAYSSIDGKAWTAQHKDAVWGDRVTFLNGEFWANNTFNLYRSPNGLSWDLATTSLVGEPIGPIIFGNGKYVTIGKYTPLGQVSVDGRIWTSFTHTNTSIESIAFGAGRFVGTVMFPTGNVVTSEDGQVWTQRATGTSQELKSVIFAQNQFWAVGEAGAILSSSDGIRWAANLAPSDTDYYGLTRWGDTVVAAGDNGTILTSTNGDTWTQRSTPSGRNLHCIEAGGGLIVAGGRGRRIMTSPDATHWTSRPSVTTNYVERLAYATHWVAACEGGDILTSSDGFNWSATRTTPPSDHEGAAFGAGYWVVAGGYFRDRNDSFAISTVFISTNRVDWDRVTVDFGVRLRDVCFGNELFVAAGNDGRIAVFSLTGDLKNPLRLETSSNLGSVSPDFQPFANFRRIRFHDGLFTVVGNDGLVMSTRNPRDPLSWIQHRSHTSQNLHDILGAADGSFYGVGNNGMILRSAPSEGMFTSLVATKQGFHLEFQSSFMGGSLGLKSSTNLLRWDLVTEPALTPLELPLAQDPARFFRLRPVQP